MHEALGVRIRRENGRKRRREKRREEGGSEGRGRRLRRQE